MSKKPKEQESDHAEETADEPEKMRRKPYEREMRRRNIITHLLSQIPYDALTPPDVELPKRQKAGGYREPELPTQHIPTPF